MKIIFFPFKNSYCFVLVTILTVQLCIKQTVAIGTWNIFPSCIPSSCSLVVCPIVTNALLYWHISSTLLMLPTTMIIPFTSNFVISSIWKVSGVLVPIFFINNTQASSSERVSTLICIWDSILWHTFKVCFVKTNLHPSSLIINALSRVKSSNKLSTSLQSSKYWCSSLIFRHNSFNHRPYRPQIGPSPTF